jgi:hypothetical protein
MNHIISASHAAIAAANASIAAAGPDSRFERPFGFGSRKAADPKTPASADAARPARYPHSVTYAEVEADLDRLIDNAIATIIDGEPVEDEILGNYVQIASLVRAISFREGKLLEYAVERLAKANPVITVLSQSLRLPLVKAAMETVTSNNWSSLDGIAMDCEAPSKGSYTPDLIIVNRSRHFGYILDLKRSLASYIDTGRLDELKIRMMAAALILPDWLYKNHKRMMIDTVGVAIIDGASRPSDHGNGIWALDEIDDLLEIDGVAACMAELRSRFGVRVRQLLEAEAHKAIGAATGQVPSVCAAALAVPPPVQRLRIDLNGPSRSFQEEQARLEEEHALWFDQDDLDGWNDDGDDDVDTAVTGHPDDADPLDGRVDDGPLVLPFRIKVGFARGSRIH